MSAITILTETRDHLKYRIKDFRSEVEKRNEANKRDEEVIEKMAAEMDDIDATLKRLGVEET